MGKSFFKWTFTAVFILFVPAMLFLFRERVPFGKSQSSFSTDPEKEITKIEFSQASEKLSLNYEGDEWLVNGRHETGKTGIMFIVRVLKEMKIKSPVSDDVFREEIISKAIEPVKVKVFGKMGLMKSFLVFKTGSNKYGNVMKRTAQSKPFIVYMPGYEGDIGSAFDVNELAWQPYRVFNILPSEIAAVILENGSDPDASFKIENLGERFVLSGQDRDLTGWDTAKVRRYITYFTWIPFESWAKDIGDEEKEKVRSGNPLYRIIVTKTGGEKIMLTLWERYHNGEKDSDRLWGKTGNSDDLFIMRYFDVDPLLKKVSYFYP